MTSPQSRKQTLRIVDASLNRLGEGLRFLEDVARLQLDDTPLTQQLKTMRHELLITDPASNQRLVEARDATGDVGVDLEVPGEEKQKELPTLVVANARRAQESLRTLEEVAKIPGINLNSEKFKQARFGLYTIEQSLLSRLLRQDKIGQLTGLYVIIDTQFIKEHCHLELARQVINGGAGIIQLRDKLLGKEKLLPIASQMRELCARHDVLFIINDYLDVALATEADGLHLGQHDLPVNVARQLLPIDKIVGCSVTTVEQATAATAEGADYIGIGSIYPTTHKATAMVVGLERLRQVRRATSLPLVAIGGINKDNAAAVIETGADAVALIGAILDTESPREATRQLIKSLKEEK